MNKLLASTAVCLMVGTAAFAQSNNATTNSPNASQPQNSARDRDHDSASQRAPDPAAQNRPSGSERSQNQAPNSAQNQPSGSAKDQPSGSAQNQSAGSKDQPSSAAQNQPSGSAKDQPSNAAQNQPAPNSGTNQSSQPSGSSSPSQAQGNPPSQSGGSSSPAQAQGNNPPASNQAQQSPGSTNSGTNTAQQPPSSNQTNAAQSRQGNVNASVNLNEQQRTRVSQSFAKVNVQPLRSVNFSVSVGTVVPRDVHLQTVPADIVEIVPQYRGYSFFAVRDEIVIVDPASYKIVTVLPRSGGTAAASESSHKRVTFSDKDRDVVRKHVRSSTERRTTGSSATRVEIRRGERVPDAVEMEEFPETVYREAPALREYRYIHRDSRTYVVEPTERRVIEEID